MELLAKKNLYKMDKLSVSKKFSKKFTDNLFNIITNQNTCKHHLTEEKIRMGISSSEGMKINPNYEDTYMRLIEGNREYVEEKTKVNATYFKDLSLTQTPKYLLIGCSDSRVPPNEMTKTEPGEIFIHRNIANQVIFSDINCMSVIQYAVDYLKVEHIIVMGHTKCGGIIAANNKMFKGLIESWLQNIKDVALQNKAELDKYTDEDEFIKKLTELNVKAQALNVCKSPYVQKAWAEGRDLHVHGWLCDIETGLIKDLAVTNKDWNEIKNIYNFKFN